MAATGRATYYGGAYILQKPGLVPTEANALIQAVQTALLQGRHVKDSFVRLSEIKQKQTGFLIPIALHLDSQQYVQHHWDTEVCAAISALAGSTDWPDSVKITVLSKQECTLSEKHHYKQMRPEQTGVKAQLQRIFTPTEAEGLGQTEARAVEQFEGFFFTAVYYESRQFQELYKDFRLQTAEPARPVRPNATPGPAKTRWSLSTS